MTRHTPDTLHALTRLVPALHSLKESEDQLKTQYFKEVFDSSLTANTDTILHQLSCKVSNFWGYEVRLSQENPPDLLVCISEKNKTFLQNSLKNQLFTSYEWKIIKEIVDKWCDSAHAISAELINIWLEFDQKPNTIPNPNFFFAPNPTLGPKSLRNLCTSVFNDHLSSKLPTDVLDYFEYALSKLPYEAFTPQIGMMLARNHTNLRVYVHKIPSEKMTGYLSQIGWKYANKDFSQLISALSKFSECIDLDIDVSNSITETIGLECYFKDMSSKKLKLFLNLLCELGFASKIMAERLLNYFKKIEYKETDQHTEFLHHIKISYNPSGSCEAKAYLGIRKM